MNTKLTKTGKPRRKRSNVAIDGPKPVDVHVGNRLRLRRTLLGISQEKLGDSVNLTFQQIQKYERGTNRIGASRLFEFCQILDVDVGYFFDELDRTEMSLSNEATKGMSDQKQAGLELDPMTRRETLELVRAYYKITNPSIRKKIYELVRSIGSPSEND